MASAAYSGAFGVNVNAGKPPTLTSGKDDNRNPAALTFSASQSSSIYGNSLTVQPNSYTVLYIMKIKA